MRHGNHAVVVGGSMAGLLAARALSEFFDRVTIVERDAKPREPEPRKGVPQGRHVHVILARGAAVLDELFPGLRAELVDGGAVELDVCEDMRVFTLGGWGAGSRSGVVSLGASRPFLELHVDRALQSVSNVELLEDTSVRGLRASAGGVDGVRVDSTGESYTIPADFVVDASGRGSLLPRWLVELGYEAPAVREVGIDMGYGSRIFRAPSTPYPWKMLVVLPQAPGMPRGGLISPMEGGRVIATLAGWCGDHPPKDPEGWLEFGRGFATPALAEVLEKLEPLAPLASYHFQANQRRVFENLTRFPDRLAVIGDSVCSFNPVFGQGMTIAAFEAIELRDALREAKDLSEFNRSFRRRVGRVVDPVWQQVTTEDLRFPAVEGPRTALTHIMHWYGGKLLRGGAHDAVLFRTFWSVANFVLPPTRFFRPDIAARVLTESWRGRGRESNMPAI